MKNLSKILSMLLVVVMCVSLFGGSAFAFDEIGGNANSASNTNSGGSVATASLPTVNEGLSNGNNEPSTNGGLSEIGGGENQSISVANNEGISTTDYASIFVDGAPYTGTLAEAVAAATSTITLAKDITTAVPFGTATNKNLTINLGGFSLALSAPLSMNGNSTITIRNGRITGAVAALESTATLNLSDINAGNGGVTLNSDAKVNINGGTYGTGFVKTGVTITTGTFEENPAGYLATNSSVSGVGPYVVTNSVVAGIVSNTRTGMGYASVSAAAGAANVGDTIKVTNSSSAVVDSVTKEITKSITLDIGDNELQMNHLVVRSGVTLNIYGSAFTPASLIIDSGATVNFQGATGTVVGNAVTVSNGATLNVSSPARFTANHGIMSTGSTNITGAANITGAVLSGGTFKMNNSSAKIGTMYFGSGKMDVSAGTVSATDFADYINFGGTAVKGITGGTWGVTYTTNFDKFVQDGYVRSGSASPYTVVALSYNPSDVASVSSNTYYYYQAAGSQSKNVDMSYSITLPNTSVTYDVFFVTSNGETAVPAGAFVKTGSGTSSTYKISKDASVMGTLPAEAVGVKFVFSNGYVNSANTIYVIPEILINDNIYYKASGDTVYYTMPSAPAGGFYYRLSNGSTTASLLPSSYYSLSNVGGDVRMTLNDSFLENLSNGTTVYVWFAYGDAANRVWAMPSFGVNVTPSGSGSGSGSGGSGSGGGSTSTGDIVVKPVYDGYWYYGDGNMEFRVNDEVTYIKVDEFKVGLLDYIDNDDYYITLGKAYMATLSNGWHTLTVYNNTKSGSCTFYVGPSLVPKDTDKHTIGSSLNLKYVCSSAIARVYVGDVRLDSEYYSLSSNGRVVTLTAEFLNNRTAGNTYTISVLTQDNETASSTFRILTKAQASASPRTGDTSNLVLWTIVLTMSGAAAVVVLPKLKKHED